MSSINVIINPPEIIDVVINPVSNTSITVSPYTISGPITENQLLSAIGTAIITGTFGINGGTGISISHSGNSIIINISGIVNENPNSCLLLDSTNGVTSLDWNGRILKDGYQNYSILYHDRTMRDAAQDTVLDWNNKILNGNWSVQNGTGNYFLDILDNGNGTAKIGINNNAPQYFNLDINSSLGNSIGNLGIGAAGNINIYPNDNLILSPVGKVGINQANPNFTLDIGGIIGNSTGALSGAFINVGSAGLSDGTHISVDWGNRNLRDTANNQALNWSNRILLDNSNNQSIDWSNRIIYNSSSAAVIDWQNNYLKDIAGNPSLDWNNKTLSGKWTCQSLAISSGAGQNPVNTSIVVSWMPIIVTGVKYFIPLYQ